MGHFRKKYCTVFPTNRCNLACTYCLANHNDGNRPEDQDIDINFAKQGIKDYFSHGFAGLRFYSAGEPMQALDICDECVKFAKSLVGDRLKVEMQSNCVYNSDQTKWVNENVNTLWVSLDGPPEINDELRVDKEGNSTIQQVLDTIAFLKKENKTFVGIRATLTDKTIFKQNELIDYFAFELGIKFLWAEPVFETINSRDGDSVTKVELLEYAREFINAYYYAKNKGVFWGNNFIVNFDEECKVGCRSCDDIPAPHLTTDGYVSCCDLGLYGDTKLKYLIYGKWNKTSNKIDYNIENLDRIRSRRVDNIKACQKCNIADYCAGGCLGMAYFETNDFFGVITDYCDITRYFAKKIPPKSFVIEHLHP